METLKFNVDKQHIVNTSPHPYLVAGTQNYLECDFQFDASWVGYNKVAVFEQKHYVPIFGNRCRVPDDVARLKRFSVRIVGEKKDVRIVTDFAVIDQR